MHGFVNTVDNLDSMERNITTFEGRDMELIAFHEKANFPAILWGSTDKALKDFLLYLIVLNWKDVIGQ